MARNPEELAHEVVLRAQQRMTMRAIGRALHIGRNRVRKILRAHQAARTGATPPTALPPPPAKRPSMLDEHAPFMADLLARFPDITAQRVYEELIARESPAFDGGYTIVKQYVRACRPRPVVEVSTPVEEPEPGQVAECDWASILIDFKNRTQRRLQIFGYSLAYSHRRYYRFYDRPDFTRCSTATSRPSAISRASRRSASTTVRRPWCCGGKVHNRSIIHASSPSRPITCFGRGPAGRGTPTTSRTSS